MRRLPILFLALMLALPAVVRAGDLWGDPLPGQDPPGPIIIVPDPPPVQVHWSTDIASAKQEAMRTGKLLFVLDLDGSFDDERLRAARPWGVTFADRRVADLLNDQFVCVWRNRAPGRPWDDLPQWIGNGSVNMYFCSSNGYVMNELGGSWAPADFVEEARFALDVARDLTHGGEAVSRTEAARELTARHDEAARRLQRELEDWQRMRRPWDRETATHIQALPQRIAFHRAQAQSPLQDVEGLIQPMPRPLPRPGG